jgi:hypothetical protein
MTVTERLLSQELKKAEPSLDLLGADRKVLQVAYDDFKNYEKFLAFSSEKTMNDSEIAQQAKNDSRTNEEFLSAWANLWLKKWKQRFSLLLGQTDMEKQAANPEKLANAQATWTKLSCREEMLEMIATTLIRNSEVCGISIIAEDILRRELMKTPTLDVDCAKQVLTLLNASLTEARKMSMRIGPLVHIKVDKEYYCDACQ